MRVIVGIIVGIAIIARRMVVITSTALIAIIIVCLSIVTATFLFALLVIESGEAILSYNILILLTRRLSLLIVALKFIGDTLAKGDKLTFVGFGTFEVRERAAREGRNPRDPGKKIHIPAKKAPAFKAGKALKEKVEKAKVKVGKAKK